MERKVVSGIMLTTLLMGMLTLAFDIQRAGSQEPPAIGKVPDQTVIQGAVYATNSGDIEIVSVVYDPDVKSYPDKSESPYGPDVNPTYNLVKQALVYLNPGNPDNPLSNIIQQGDTVVLKPNLVGESGFAREGCTRTPILRPLVDFAVQAGASKVIIAEGSAYPYPDSIVFGPEYSNITGLVQALESMYPDVVITYKDLNLDDFTWVDLGENSTLHGVYTPQQLYSKDNIRMDEDSYYYAQDCNGYNPKGYRPGLYAIANTVFQADVFINVPKMKVHWITGVTLSLKNLIGVTVSSTGNTTHEESIKDIPHWNNSGPKPVYDEVLTRQDSFENDVVWRVMADLNKVVLYADENGVLKPVKQRRYLSVVDAIIGMEGPTVYNPPGVPRPTGAIIAGQNPVAVDAVCSRVMGFNYTVLNSLINMEQLSDHPIGQADPTEICVAGTSLNGQTFWEPYVPHKDYEDSQIAPYKIRLQYFDPPAAELIKISPETPREGLETKVIVSTQNIDLVAAVWLRYSLDGAEPTIIKMVPSGETLVGNLGLLEGGTMVSYDVCLQDYFFNTGWSDKMHVYINPFRKWDVGLPYGIINIVDIVYVALGFDAERMPNGTYWHTPPCNATIPCPHDPNADINDDGFIDIVDIVLVAVHFGEVFWDDFTGDLSDWTIISGTWNIVDGMLDGQASGGGLIYAGDLTWTDYVLNTQVMFLPDSMWNEAGFIVRFTDSGNFYWLGLGCWGHKVSISKKTDGASQELVYSGSRDEVLSDTWYDLKIVCRGSLLWLYVNDVLELEHDDSGSPHLSGAIGVRPYNSHIQVEHVKVTT